MSRRVPVRARNQDVVRAASIAGGLADNVSETILGRINIDHLRAIDDPVASGQDTTALRLVRIQEVIVSKRALRFTAICYNPATKGLGSS
jgi:hypothetical protein